MSIRRVTLIVVLALGSIAIPSASQAATIGLVGAEGGPQQLRYQAADRERNDVRIDPWSFETQDVLVTEASAPLTLGSGCTATPDVRCHVPLLSGPGTGVRAVLGDRADAAYLVPFWVDSFVWGGKGDDDIYSNGSDHGDGWGGPGDDTIALGAEQSSEGHGGDGDDTLTATAAAIALYGDDGNDTMRGSGSFSHVYDGGRGADTIVTPGGPFASGSVDGGDGGDVIVAAGSIAGGGGGDRIDTSGNDSIDGVSCGTGNDVVVADADDTVAGDCESVTRAPVATAASAALRRAERRAEAAFRRGAASLRQHRR